MNDNFNFNINNIYKSYNHHKKVILNNISVNECSGNIVGILGANGCGKSTLLTMISQIKCDKKIAFVPQQSPLVEELSALDNLRLWFCDSPKNIKEELDSGFLAMLGINEYINLQVKKMSGGMKKKLSIACAMAKDPDILLLDEPGAALDLICKERIEVYLKHLRSQNKLIFIATHEEREIALCDKLYILKNGKLHPYCFDGNIHGLIKDL